MNKKIVLTLSLFILICSPVFASKVDFFYSPTCPHCQKVSPFVNELSKYYPINFIDISQGSYNVDGVPLMVINTKDGRNIELVGSQEIPKYSLCELNEMTTMECPTYSVDEGYNCDTHSWFIR